MESILVENEKVIEQNTWKCKWSLVYSIAEKNQNIQLCQIPEFITLHMDLVRKKVAADTNYLQAI